jgi:hypothetical protein
MKTRDVEVTIIVPDRGGANHVRFMLACHPDTRIVPGQVFEIVSPGCDSVRAQPIPNQVINRSDGTASARMLGDNSIPFSTLVTRLEQLPNVSHIRVGRV